MEWIAARYPDKCSISKRQHRLWMCRANNSFPVPVSPRIKTVESDGATFAISRSTLRSASEEPTISSKHQVTIADLFTQGQVFVPFPSSG